MKALGVIQEELEGNENLLVPKGATRKMDEVSAMKEPLQRLANWNAKV